jgi:hypothetical protein
MKRLNLILRFDRVPSDSLTFTGYLPVNSVEMCLRLQSAEKVAEQYE